MANNLGIKKTHQMMKDHLIDYIKSQYFGDNELLMNASDEILKKEGILYQKPYIESTPSYLKVPNGISCANIDKETKDFFEDLIKNQLGVFKNPFKHQVDALENFANCKNLFVATGTGSGKTECFMWPIIYKLVYEAIHNKESWKQRGVRTIVIYPMNALVSDQISRLRSIIGDRNNKYVSILNEYVPNSRRPQFGMYTGRTPYAGDSSVKKSNLEIAESYKNSFLVNEDLNENQKEEQRKDIEGLKKINKYPSKDMETFVRYLENDDLKGYDSSNDAELLLRYEMQHYTPDILITNYSMLEYMLIRKIENNIWKDTTEWLNKSKDNKLLIIIDEAHMYSGASGGEVALLIRRLFSKLGITHDKVQFIMTSASMPNESMEDLEYIHEFSENLSGCKWENFEYLFGERDNIELINEVQYDIDKLANLNLDSSVLDEDTINKNISLFAEKVYGESVFNNQRVWLYNNFNRYKPFVNLIKNCQGIATSYDELELKTIGYNNEKADKAFENLLLIAPLAKDENNNVLFPARIHLFFRGLNGIFACVNPNCDHKHEGSGIHIGELYTSNIDQCPKCNSKIYELINDRRCGALFIKGYINKNSSYQTEVMFWNKKGIDENEDYAEIDLYLLPDNYNIESRPKNTEIAYLDFVSSKLYTSNINKETCIPVLRPTELKEDGYLLSKCPHCDELFRNIQLKDFQVKGNLPFFNIIKSQFDAQPMTKQPTKYTPNGGKKVLLFSDSRQSAAILARDMTKISDYNSFRKAIYLAMEKIFLKDQRNEFSMKYLYPAFVEICVENNLRFFYGRQLDKLEGDKEKMIRYLERYKKQNREIDYGRLEREFNTPCQMYQADLIDLFCSPTNSFYNLGLGYIVPLDDKLYDILDDLNIERLDKEEFIKIFTTFVVKTCTDSFCFDNTVNENIRKEVKYIKGNRYGFIDFKSLINKEIKKKYPNDYEQIYKTIVDEFYRTEDDSYFLNLDSIKFVLTEEDKEWVVCNKCGKIHPFDIEGKCSICGSDDIKKIPANKIEKIDYWRKPVVSDEVIKSVNTEEHTAQLSFKDQKINTWAKTEDYEMRFQDVNVETISKFPIDILSCTTTMEVGIDIGSLTAIGLRNVPPLRENYQQRAGRAGRRGSSLSTISVYAQNGPHDSYYFKSPEKIIRGKLRKPWVDVNNDKIIYRHFNLIVFTKFFEFKSYSLYDIKLYEFKELLDELKDFIKQVNFSKDEIGEYFIGHNVLNFKNRLVNDLDKLFDKNYADNKKIFDLLYEKGILPTYSFPLDVIEFNIEDGYGKTQLAPSRGIDIALSEFAPGRVIVVDKKTYKSAGIYSPIRHKGENTYFKPAEPYFNDGNEYFKKIYVCRNRLCGWFGETKPKDGKCPFCGEPLVEETEKNMLIPWGFAPLNAKEIPESEAENELTYSDEPCYSATPSEDLKVTKYKNLFISNRKNEEIIILNKGKNDEGFDVCRDCGAAQPHSQYTLKDNGIGAPFTNYGKPVNCSHKNVVEGIYLGTKFRTDMFFMQVNINTNLITNENTVLKSASVTLCEAMKLATSRILDISYNDLTIGSRIRNDGINKFIDIYFYDGLSSGAGYSTQMEYYLDNIIEDTFEILSTDDSRDICNFWNQRIQHLFRKNLAYDLLNWTVKGILPEKFSEEKTINICKPLINILQNEASIICSIKNNILMINGENYKIIPAFKKKNRNEISDFDIEEKLPNLVDRIL